MKSITCKLFMMLMGVVTFLVVGCEPAQKSQDKAVLEYKAKAPKEYNYAPTVFSKDTTELWLAEGSTASDTVLILGDGGPKNLLDYEFNGKIAMAYLPNFKNYYNVNLHQATTFNRDIFNWKYEFTLDMAKKETENTVEMMHRAIKYFKDRGKYVIVAGHSYSAFVIPNYIANYPSLADKYIITGGRFKADSLQTVYQKKDINTIFLEGGKEIRIPDENRPPNPNRPKKYFKIRTAKNFLKAALGDYDYTRLLKDKDLSNITFFYGNKDRNVGVPSTYELDFLASKNVQVIEADSDHYGIWRTMIERIESGEVSL
ncbi:hypothetical protein [Aquimarina litoralis]|uniref:hypothetical protein n=1 Tax=Aquimarina litoralis TaxID=584605 RepID=UPI001C56636A|nr:hypothetical protein [Aquimarina litoralis]MBW1298484.1 hypothetical protein [Aquimarina litoralis]